MSYPGKRLLDLVVVVVTLPLTVPVLVVTSLVVAAALGRPVLFRQERAGLRGRPFQLVKFRTMTDARDASGELLADAHRLTRFGRFLRSTSLDELPELWNIVRGEMSLVGPRPLPVRYLPRYSAAQARRHDVLPGLTGLAQVSGRNAVDWDDRLAFDVEYVRRASLGLDLSILLRTLGSVVSRRGVSAPGEATMSEFKG